MNTTLILEPIVSGHIMEWLNHYYKYVANNGNRYVFCVPQMFYERNTHLDWPKADNIEIVLLKPEEVSACNRSSLLMSALSYCRCIRNYCKKYSSNEVFLSFLMKTMPFLPFLLPKGVKVSGILLRIYIYDKEKRGLRLWLEKLRYLIMTLSRSIKRVYVLNDRIATERLNKIYNTDKFKYIPDPLPEFSEEIDIRNCYGISDNDVVYFQFGSLDQRKNTLNIVKAIKLMSKDELSGKVFIFAGILNKSIESEFLHILDEVKDKARIILIRRFLSYSELNNLCFSCNYLFTIYNNTNQSSGTVGYSAYFKKPVIGVADGLLGNIIRENKLGYMLDEITPETIKDAINNPIRHIGVSDYVETHSIQNFCETIFN